MVKQFTLRVKRGHSSARSELESGEFESGEFESGSKRMMVMMMVRTTTTTTIQQGLESSYQGGVALHAPTTIQQGLESSYQGGVALHAPSHAKKCNKNIVKTMVLGTFLNFHKPTFQSKPTF